MHKPDADSVCPLQGDDATGVPFGRHYRAKWMGPEGQESADGSSAASWHPCRLISYYYCVLLPGCYMVSL